MYILMIARGYPSKEYPQWGCFEQDQAEALAMLGHKIVVLSVDSRFRWRFRKLGITHYYKDGVNYYNSFWIPGAITNIISRRLSLFLQRIQLDKMYKKVVSLHGKPDVIYGQFFFNTAIGVYLKYKYDIPLVGIEHAARFNEDKLDVYTKTLASYAYDNVDAAISVSDSLKERLLKHFNIDSIVINNMVGAEFSKPLVKKASAGKVCFVSTGSLIYRKGFDLLLTAFKRLNLPPDCWQLFIIGEGEEHEKLQNQINNLGLSDNVSLTGHKNKEEIVKILSNSDVFVLPSRSETFGVVYIEAMMIGLPIIATICGGPEHFVQETDGLLIPVDDVDALSDAIEDMYENHQRYDRKKIAEDARKRFSPSVIAQQLTDVFSKVINKQ